MHLQPPARNSKLVEFGRYCFNGIYKTKSQPVSNSSMIIYYKLLPYPYIDTTFSVEHEAFGVIRVHELKPGGKLVPVRSYNFYA